MLNYKKIISIPLLVASLLLTICMAWVTYSMYQLIEIAAEKDLIDLQRYNVVSLSNAVSSAEVGLKGYVLTHNVKMLNRYQDGQSASDQYIKNLVDSGLKFTEVEAIFKQVATLIAKHKALLASNVQIEFNGGSYASHLGHTKDYGEALVVAINSALNQADSLLYERRLEYVKKAKKQVELTVISGIVTALIVFMLLFFSYKKTAALFKSVMEKETIVTDLNHQATHDPLTKLINRRGFESALVMEHEESIATRKQYGVLFLDLDGFKAVNDTYGHDVGDKLLEQVAELFSQAVRGNDLLARLGGDEFALIIRQFKYEAELKPLADRLIECLAKPILINGDAINIGVSIGIATFPKHANTVEALLGKADEAMYASKNSGKNKHTMATL